MSTMAFLASIVNPRVGSRAYKAGKSQDQGQSAPAEGGAVAIVPH